MLKKYNQIIFKHLVEINNIEVAPGEIYTRYTYKYISLKIIKKAINKFSLNWSYDIIQSEFVEALWEAIEKSNIKFKEDMNYIVSNLNKEDPCTKTYFKYLEIATINTMIDHLLENNNRKQKLVNGKHINDYLYLKEINFSEFGEDYSFIENLFLNTSSLFEAIEKDPQQNYFYKWFKENKEMILTTKQKQFISNYNEYDRKAKYKYTQTIAKRVIKLFLKRYNTKDIRIIEMQDKLNMLDKLIYDPTINNLRASMSNQYIADIVYNNMNLQECKEIVRMYNGEDNVNKKLLQKIFNNIIKESIKIENNIKKYKNEGTNSSTDFTEAII